MVILVQWIDLKNNYPATMAVLVGSDECNSHHGLLPSAKGKASTSKRKAARYAPIDKRSSHHPFTVVSPVRIRLGVPINNYKRLNALGRHVPFGANAQQTLEIPRLVRTCLLGKGKRCKVWQFSLAI